MKGGFMLASRASALRICAFLLAFLAAAASLPVVAAEAVTITDGGGRTVTVTDTSRILSVGGDVTEILYALGAGDRIVAVDTTSQFPASALKDKKSVGYMRALSSEGVLSVGATLVIASEAAGPPEVVKTLKSTSVPYVEVADRSSPEGIAAKVALIAKVIGAKAEGDKLVQQMMVDFADLAQRRAKIKRPLRALFVLAIQNGRLTVGGQTTSAEAIINLAGAINAAENVKGFRPLPDEAVVELAPDVIFAMRRSGAKSEHDLSQIFVLKGVQATPAGKAKRIVMVDGQYMLGFGPRTPAAARELMSEFYPALAGTDGNAMR
jgi:iron complex transport system substrate-binding protein